MVKRLVILTAVFGIWAVSGCGNEAKPTTSSSVEGVVTLNGTELVEGGTVNFTSPSTGNAAIALVGPDGKFVVIGGMVPGEYKVTVTPLTPTPEHPTPKDSSVPGKYRSPVTSDLTSKITSGKNDLKFELKS